ncbi:MAG: hypothetical protein KJ697_00955 [Nanoarchaeota archaeon]|nr:hypothetical protein [Nanoarchaeota archaeon]
MKRLLPPTELPQPAKCKPWNLVDFGKPIQMVGNENYVGGKSETPKPYYIYRVGKKGGTLNFPVLQWGTTEETYRKTMRGNVPYLIKNKGGE